MQKRQIKVQIVKGNKSPNRKVYIEQGNRCSNKKRNIKSKQKRDLLATCSLIITFKAILSTFLLGPLIKKIKMEENSKTDEKINGDDQIKAEESTLTMTEPKKETLEELELSKTNNQLIKKLAMFENTLKSIQNDIVIPLKERITRLELEKKGSQFFLNSKYFILI